MTIRQQYKYVNKETEMSATFLEYRIYNNTNHVFQSNPVFKSPETQEKSTINKGITLDFEICRGM